MDRLAKAVNKHREIEILHQRALELADGTKSLLSRSVADHVAEDRAEAIASGRAADPGAKTPGPEKVAGQQAGVWKLMEEVKYRKELNDHLREQLAEKNQMLVKANAKIEKLERLLGQFVSQNPLT